MLRSTWLFFVLSPLLQPEMWQKCLDSIEELLDILFSQPNIFIGENIAEDSENLSNAEQVSVMALGICSFSPSLGIQPTKWDKVIWNQLVGSVCWPSLESYKGVTFVHPFVSSSFLHPATPCTWLHSDTGWTHGWRVHQDHAEHRSPFPRWACTS